MNFGQYPERRMRRLRRTAFLRDMVRESSLSSADFIYPVFILEGKNQRQSIASMPGIERVSVDLLLPVAEEMMEVGIPAIALFPVIENSLKTPSGEEAHNANGLVPRAVRELKKRFPDLGVITDVALDPFTTHGQDGVIDEHGYILNDETIDVLKKQALTQAEAGVDSTGDSGAEQAATSSNSEVSNAGGAYDESSL